MGSAAFLTAHLKNIHDCRLLPARADVLLEIPMQAAALYPGVRATAAWSLFLERIGVLRFRTDF